jgi:uroporphyrinogen-III synthase
MTPFRLLITKKVSPSLVINSGLKGIEIMEKEFIKTVPVNNPQLPGKIKSLLSRKTAVAFTSKNAVAGVGLIAHKQSLPDWRIFCLDGLTRDEVITHFPENKIDGTARNARSLATLILKSNIEKRIIFFCGNKRRDDLPDILKNDGFEVEELVVYDTELCPVKIVDDFDVVAFFSPSAVESFFSLNELNKKVVCFSVGKTTTTALKKYTVNRIITSEKPSEESIVELVLKYRSER